jgi:hypothetical protein
MMARKSKSAGRRSVAPPARALAVSRNLVAAPEQLAPVFVDFATLVGSMDTVVHSLFQTRPPVTGIERTTTQVDSVLVGRFVYTNAHFAELTRLFVRQLIKSEGNRNSREFVEWLAQQLTPQPASPLVTAAPSEPARQGTGAARPRQTE